MSAFWQFKALIRKNVLTLKRSVFTTLLEIFYPIILMLVGYLVELIFASKKFVFENEGGLDNYLIDKGNFGFDYNVYTHLAGIKMFENQEDYFNHIKDKIGNDELTKLRGKLLFIQSNLSPDNGVWKYVDPLNEVHDIPLSTISGLPNKPITMICYNRFSIAFVGFKEDDESGPGPTIKRYIEIEAQSLNRKYNYPYFKDIEELKKYIKDEDYGKPGKPTICFGIYFKKMPKKIFRLRFIILTILFRMELKMFRII